MLAVVALILGGCSSSVTGAGRGSPAASDLGSAGTAPGPSPSAAAGGASAATASVPVDTAAAPTDATAASSAPITDSKSTSAAPTHPATTTTTTRTASPTSTAPHIDQMTLSYPHTCKQGNASSVSPVLTWKVSHATGVALSIDDPGEIGATGTYGAAASVSPISIGCSGNPGTVITHYWDLWTVGGTGPRAHRELVSTVTIVAASG